MVLKLLLILLLFWQPVASLACDPNMQPEEIFTLLLSPEISPGVLTLAASMVFIPELPLPQTWDSVSVSGSSPVSQEFAVLLFRAVLPVFGFMANKLQDNLAGRIILNASPLVLRALRDGLQSGGWQTLVVQLSLPISGKVVVYQSNGKIEFIDEIDSTLNLSITAAWPPVLVKHLRVWDRHGIIYAWPQEDSSLLEGVVNY